MAREYGYKFFKKDNGKCDKKWGYYDDGGDWQTVTNYGETDCPPNISTGSTLFQGPLTQPKRPNPPIRISKMEVQEGQPMDTNTILKWAAIAAAVVLVGWYVWKKMR